MTKTCSKCREEKPLDAFHRSSKSPTGRQAQCKDCSKASNDAWRAANPGRTIELRKMRDERNPGRRAEVQKRWAQAHPESLAAGSRRYSERHPDRKREQARQWAILNPTKRWCHRKLNDAIKGGHVIKDTSCQDCGTSSKRLEGHHEDYSKPLEVVWLCKTCHEHRHHGTELKQA